MVRNIIWWIIITLWLSLFVLGKIIFDNNCNEFEESKKRKKEKDLEFEILIQKEQTAYITWFFLVTIGILVIIFL